MQYTKNFLDNVILKVGDYNQLMNKPENGGLDLNEFGIIIFPSGSYQFVYRTSLSVLTRIGQSVEDDNLSSRNIYDKINKSLYKLPSKTSLIEQDINEDGIILLSSPVDELDHLNIFNDDYTLNEKNIFDNIDFTFLRKYEALASSDDDGLMESKEIITDVDNVKFKLNSTGNLYLTGINIDDFEPNIRIKVRNNIKKLITETSNLSSDLSYNILILDSRCKQYLLDRYVVDDEYAISEIIFTDNQIDKLEFDFQDKKNTNIIFRPIGKVDVQLVNDNFYNKSGDHITTITTKTIYQITYDETLDRFIITLIDSSIAKEDSPGLFFTANIESLLNGDIQTSTDRPCAVKFNDLAEFLLSFFQIMKQRIESNNSVYDILNVKDRQDDAYIIYHNGEYLMMTEDAIINEFKSKSVGSNSFLELDKSVYVDISSLNTRKLNFNYNINNRDIKYIKIIDAFNNNTSYSIYHNDKLEMSSTSRDLVLPVVIQDDFNNIEIGLDKNIDYFNYVIAFFTDFDFNYSKLKIKGIDENGDDVELSGNDSIKVSNTKDADIIKISFGKEKQNKKTPLSIMNENKNIDVNEFGKVDSKLLKSNLPTKFGNKDYVDLPINIGGTYLGSDYSKAINKTLLKNIKFDKFNILYPIILNDGRKCMSTGLFNVFIDSDYITTSLGKLNDTINDVNSSQSQKDCSQLMKDELDTIVKMKDSKIEYSEITSYIDMGYENIKNLKIFPHEDGFIIHDKSNKKTLEILFKDYFRDKKVSELLTGIKSSYNKSVEHNSDKLNLDDFGFNNKIDTSHINPYKEDSALFDDREMSNSTIPFKWSYRNVMNTTKTIDFITYINDVIFVKFNGENINYIDISSSISKSSTIIDLDALTYTEIPNTSSRKVFTDLSNIITYGEFDKLITVYDASTFKLIYETKFNHGNIKDIVFNGNLFILTDEGKYFIDNEEYPLAKLNGNYFLDLYGGVNKEIVFNIDDEIDNKDINVVEFNENRAAGYSDNIFPQLITFKDNIKVNLGNIVEECRYGVYDSKSSRMPLLLLKDGTDYIIYLLNETDGNIIRDVTSEFYLKDISDVGVKGRMEFLNSDILPFDADTETFDVLIHEDDWDLTLGFTDRTFLMTTTLLNDDRTIIVNDVTDSFSEKTLHDKNTYVGIEQRNKILQDGFNVHDRTYMQFNTILKPYGSYINKYNSFINRIPLGWESTQLDYFEDSIKNNVEDLDATSTAIIKYLTNNKYSIQSYDVYIDNFLLSTIQNPSKINENKLKKRRKTDFKVYFNYFNITDEEANILTSYDASIDVSNDIIKSTSASNYIIANNGTISISTAKGVDDVLTIKNELTWNTNEIKIEFDGYKKIVGDILTNDDDTYRTFIFTEKDGKCYMNDIHIVASKNELSVKERKDKIDIANFSSYDMRILKEDGDNYTVMFEYDLYFKIININTIFNFTNAYIDDKLLNAKIFYKNSNEGVFINEGNIFAISQGICNLNYDIGFVLSSFKLNSSGLYEKDIISKFTILKCEANNSIHDIVSFDEIKDHAKIVIHDNKLSYREIDGSLYDIVNNFLINNNLRTIKNFEIPQFSSDLTTIKYNGSKFVNNERVYDLNKSIKTPDFIDMYNSLVVFDSRNINNLIYCIPDNISLSKFKLLFINYEDYDEPFIITNMTKNRINKSFMIKGDKISNFVPTLTKPDIEKLIHNIIISNNGLIIDIDRIFIDNKFINYKKISIYDKHVYAIDTDDNLIYIEDGNEIVIKRISVERKKTYDIIGDEILVASSTTETYIIDITDSIIATIDVNINDIINKMKYRNDYFIITNNTIFKNEKKIAIGLNIEFSKLNTDDGIIYFQDGDITHIYDIDNEILI